MKYYGCERNNKLSGFLKKLINNKSGSILTLVVVIGACLFMIAAALMTRVNTTTESTKTINFSENAYLAARSGVTLLMQSGADTDFAKKMMDSCNKADPITMDFGDLGSCEIKLTSNAANDYVDADGNTIRIVKASCLGKYEDKQFLLNRQFKIKHKKNETSPLVKPAAYTTFGDGDIKIDGGIEGPVYVMGDGLFSNKNSHQGNPMHDVVCAEALDLANSGCYYNLIASGRRLTFSQSHIKTDIYVGERNPDGDLYDNIYLYADGGETGSTIMCEGDIIVHDFKIGTENFDSATGTLKNNDISVIKAGNDPVNNKVYIGYTATPQADGTYSINSRTNDNTYVYGGITCNAELHLSGTTTVYGDIICNGDVYIEDNVTIKGNIYSGGNIFVASTVSTDVNTVFPAAKNKLYAKGVISINNAWVEENVANAVERYPNQSTIAKLNVFNTSGYVGAAEYFQDKIESNPKPKTKFPDGLTSLPVALQTSDVVHITESCVINTNMLFNGWWPIRRMYIDTATNGQNIDILLEGTITTGEAGIIVVNDNGGNNRIRIFMKGGSGLSFCNSSGSQSGFLVVSDDAASSVSASDLPQNANDSRIDRSKVPQMYFFGEEGQSNITMDLGTTGYIPGYVIMPYVDIVESGNAHCYADGTKVGYQPSNESAKSDTNYPFFYGMLMCNSVDLSAGGTSTVVKYDWNLDDNPDGTKSETRKKFDAALTDDGVISYDDTDPDDPDAPSSSESWEVSDMY